MRRYIQHLSGYSRQQMDRLIEQYRKTGHIQRRQRTVNGFETKYTKADIHLLADVNRLVDDVSGTTVKAFCQRTLEVHGDQRFARFAGISVSHLYNLRKSKVYQRCRCKYKTKGTKVNIGERCKPRPNSVPDYMLQCRHQSFDASHPLPLNGIIDR